MQGVDAPGFARMPGIRELGSGAEAFAAFEGLDFVAAADVAFFAVGEAGAEEGVDEFLDQREPDDAGAEAEHVHVVVLDTLARGVRVVAHARAYARDLVGRHARADAAAADR